MKTADDDYWSGRWRTGGIGFHEGQPNAFLQAHAGVLGSKRRVLVPLCGKAVDLAFLAAQGHQVVGVELVEEAARAFFAEHGLTPEVSKVGPFTQLRTSGVTILVGDFFATTAELLGPVDALYDRAALIALPEALRRRYVSHLRSVLAPGSVGLVITFEYPQGAIEGPPFSVPEAELREHYRGAKVALLQEKPGDNARLKAAGHQGVDRCFEVRL